jgi:hypothetical protein
MVIKSILATLLIASLLPAFITGCRPAETAQEGANLMPELRTPPIDAVPPVATETATFALG